MPLTEKGQKILTSMKKQYGPEKGEQVFYASKNAGKLTGVDDDDRVPLEEGKSKETVKKNVGKLMGDGHNREAAVGIALRKAKSDDTKPGWKLDIEFPNEKKSDDNQHLGFTKGASTPVEKLISAVDALTARVDAFELRQHQRKPVEVKPRTKDNMQPSNRHAKEV
jgi:hypothetical protein